MFELHLDLASERLKFMIWQEPEDMPYAVKLWGNPQVTKFFSKNGFSEPVIATRLKTETENYKNHQMQYFPMLLKNGNAFAGCCGLRPYGNNPGMAEMGIHLLPDFWGQGLGQEACKAIMDYGFHTLSVDTLFAGHHPDNLSSGKLLKKLGFHYVRSEFYGPTGLMHPSYELDKTSYEKHLDAM